MKKALLYILLLALVLPFAACAQPSAADVVKSDQPRETSPDASPSM
jgi:hypothetical protein